MTIEFRCIRCGQRLRVTRGDAGKRARCPTCEAIVDIPKDRPVGDDRLASRKSDVIDYELFGEELQYVEITLDPGEVTVARAEDLLYMTPGIALEQNPQDPHDSNGGILDRLSQVGRRILTGSSLTMTAFCNVGEHREVVAFAPRKPGKLLPLHLDEHKRRLTCQSSAILCVARGVEIRDTDPLGRTDPVPMQELVGDGIVVLQAPGGLFDRQLREGQAISARTLAVIALTQDIKARPHTARSSDLVPSITTLEGPGEVWLSVV